MHAPTFYTYTSVSLGTKLRVQVHFETHIRDAPCKTRWHAEKKTSKYIW